MLVLSRVSMTFVKGWIGWYIGMYAIEAQWRYSLASTRRRRWDIYISRYVPRKLFMQAVDKLGVPIKSGGCIKN